MEFLLSASRNSYLRFRDSSLASNLLLSGQISRRDRDYPSENSVYLDAIRSTAHTESKKERENRKERRESCSRSTEERVENTLKKGYDARERETFYFARILRETYARDIDPYIIRDTVA